MRSFESSSLSTKPGQLHSVRKTDSSETSRAEAEIVQKAHKSTNFKLSAEGGVNIGIVDAKAGSAMSQDAGTESQETKKDFHEAVFKAAEEYKQVIRRRARRKPAPPLDSVPPRLARCLQVRRVHPQFRRHGR